jgi:hypothetical protein
MLTAHTSGNTIPTWVVWMCWMHTSPVVSILFEHGDGTLQQQLRWTKGRKQTMSNIIHELQQKQFVSPEDAKMMHAKFDEIQLSIF